MKLKPVKKAPHIEITPDLLALKGNTLKVYLALRCVEKERGEAIPFNVTQMERDFGITQPTVAKSLTSLEQEGYIKRVGISQNKISLFCVLK